MNNIQSKILCNLKENRLLSQRQLAKNIGVSLGIINREYNELISSGFLTEEGRLTKEALKNIKNNQPKQAIILAAGYGQRMVPINMDKPKGLLTVYGETLIERLIRQLHEVGITKIYVVVGYMKEAYEFLIDQYNVELVINREYATKNNLHSLVQVSNHLDCSYIVPCDIWSSSNPFSMHECNSWYMMSDLSNPTSDLHVSKQFHIVLKDKRNEGNCSIGIAYINHPDAKWLKERLVSMAEKTRYDNSFWEDCLFEGEGYRIGAKLVRHEDVHEINTYEDLRDIDEESENLKSDTISVIAKALHTNNAEIKNIQILKKGMTNRSFLFECQNQRYIMRIPGEGTDKLIDRKKEAAVYRALDGKRICDDVIYINEKNGYKITKFMENSRVCDANSQEDLRACMKVLRSFHNQNLQVKHTFDLYGQLEYYEKLWNGKKSIYQDYEVTKKHILSLRKFVESNIKKKTLTHIDAVPDNFMIQILENGKQDIRLIDWEYAGMQDPDLDIAMFSIYSLYEREQIDNLISIYYENKVDLVTKYKIYAYVAIAGLLWSNWCEYKRLLGVDFGEYSLKQYRYAKVYYRIVQEEFLSHQKGEKDE